MRNSTLIIVSGLSATGKTTLARKLSRQLKLPLISKDTIKELLFDGVGHGNREWGEKLNSPTYAILEYFVEEQLRSGHSLIIETPFDSDFRAGKFLHLQEELGFHCVQVLCHADPKVLIDRFAARIGASGRHPGHNDEAAFENFKASLDRAYPEPLSLEGDVFRLDTTDFAKVNSDSLFRKLQSHLAEVPSPGEWRSKTVI